MTIKDIARESGYAVSTVSRALNGPERLLTALLRESGCSAVRLLEHCGICPQQLCAVRLEFCHPITGEAICIASKQRVRCPEETAATGG